MWREKDSWTADHASSPGGKMQNQKIPTKCQELKRRREATTTRVYTTSHNHHHHPSIHQRELSTRSREEPFRFLPWELGQDEPDPRTKRHIQPTCWPEHWMKNPGNHARISPWHSFGFVGHLQNRQLAKIFLEKAHIKRRKKRSGTYSRVFPHHCIDVQYIHKPWYFTEQPTQSDTCHHRIYTGLIQNQSYKFAFPSSHSFWTSTLGSFLV